MKFLKTKNISKHSVSDRTFIVQHPTGRATINSKNSLRLPIGSIAFRPEQEADGMVRFTTNDTADHEINDTAVYWPTRAVGLEVYYEGKWYPIRLQGPSQIQKKNLGAGVWDNGPEAGNYTAQISRYFPISGEPLDLVPGLDQGLDPQDYVDNMIVIVENVFQVSGTNFELVESDGIVVGVEILAGGTGLTPSSTAVATFTTPSGGVAATGTATIDNTGVVEFISIDTPGSGYTGLESYAVSVAGESGGSYTVKIAKPGWHIKFLSAVPTTKPVIVYYGYDQ
jgi:hypothetical protein